MKKSQAQIACPDSGSRLVLRLSGTKRNDLLISCSEAERQGYCLLITSETRVLCHGKNFFVNPGKRSRLLSQPFLGEIIDLSRRTAESVFFKWGIYGIT